MTSFAPSQQDISQVFEHNLHKTEDTLGDLTPFSLEILEKVIEAAYYLEDSSKKQTNRNRNIEKLSEVNSIFYVLTLKYRYRYCKFIRSNMFYRFLLTLMNDTTNGNVGEYVRTLDFQELTSVGLGRSDAMNTEIQDLTARTILQCLKLTPNLHEFLATESIEGDISPEIIHFLFNCLPNLRSIDFCGSSGVIFSNSFNQLEVIAAQNNIQNLSFHECTDLSPIIFRKLLPNLESLQRLDLTHTKVSASDLRISLNKNCRLTHLSLSKCFNIGDTHDFISLLVNHPAINNPGLLWLNLQNHYSIVLLKADAITYLITKLDAPNLHYLNLDGYSEINQSHLELIVTKFPNLHSLAVSRLQPGANIECLKQLDHLKYLDISYYATTFGKLDYVLTQAPESLEVVEIDTEIGENLPDVYECEGTYWRVHNSSGQSRRVWVHRVESVEDAELYDNYYNNRVFFNTETGAKYDGEFKRPIFMKYASRKVSCCDSAIGEPDEAIFPNTLCERGLYRYYSLHK